MARINLLPWREELRKEKQRQFLSILGLVFVLGVVVVMSYKYTVGMQIDTQVQRNNFLKAEIKSLEKQIKERKKGNKEKNLVKENHLQIQGFHCRRIDAMPFFLHR